MASYTWEQKVRAVERYLSCGGRALDVIRELGYPGCAGSLLRWVRAMAPGGREAFENSGRRYGYRRVWLELRGAGIVVSAKRVMRLMTRHGLVPPLKRARRYSSYRGEIGGETPANLVGRDFHAEAPNRLWVTDITEFSIPAGKAYLSPVIDCCDGMPVAWTIGTSITRRRHQLGLVA
ncbi:IS3 family transposase [uncultured Bifidobacterium sp.]|uniref:IS3 family transposase n=1 Tax=uncultured Bifidobacterium sp. TaxID=165187 RepID=UPI0035A91865